MVNVLLQVKLRYTYRASGSVVGLDWQSHIILVMRMVIDQRIAGLSARKLLLQFRPTRSCRI
jgi:hypothetical protein